MANEVLVGSRWQWPMPSDLAPFTYVAAGRIHYDDDTPGHSWAMSPGRIADGAVPLPAPAAEQPLCTRCDDAEVAAGCRCPKCGFDAPAAECAGCGFSEGNMCIVCMDRGQAAQIAPPAPPPPRCAPGCAPARPCEAIGVCPIWREDDVDRYMLAYTAASGIPSDIPPAREPRIGALSWGHARVCGGLSTRRGR